LDNKVILMFDIRLLGAVVSLRSGHFISGERVPGFTQQETGWVSERI